MFQMVIHLQIYVRKLFPFSSGISAMDNNCDGRMDHPLNLYPTHLLYLYTIVYCPLNVSLFFRITTVSEITRCEENCV